MEKQPKKSKKLLWILLAVAVAVIGIAAAALAVFSGIGNTEPQGNISDIYWNVERSRYISKGYHGVSGRIPDSDGYYRINMAVNGEQTMVVVEDVNLVNRIDFQEVMGLSFDENGVVNDVLYLEEFTGGIVADKFVVESVDGNRLVCNSSAKYKGLELTYTLTDETKIYQIGDFEPMVGMPTAIAQGDQVLMIQDLAGNITHVYVFPYVPPGDVYWNITRMFDNATQLSTRERDELGYFNYEFAVNGQIQSLRTKDQAVADLIDKHASQAMGLVFDENGDIIEVLNAGNIVCGGGLVCNRYLVTQLEGDSVTMTLGQTSYTESISKDCKYFDVTGVSGPVGMPAEGVQLGDKVTALRDRRGQVCLIFITNRLTNDDIYWVVERNEVWNRTTWTTNRKPAADGWYYIKLAGCGKQITAKTRDAQLVNTLDSYVCWCVSLNGDEIVGIQDAANRYGGSLFGAFQKVLALNDGKITVQRPNDTATAKLAEDCIVYNVSTSSVTVGEPGQIRVGDTIYGFTDLDGVVRYVFVTSTTYNGRIYWNATRYYDDVNKVTTRQKGEDGYYHFEMVVDGKVVFLKTASKEIATKVDLVKTRARGLKLSGDIIIDVLAPEKLTAYPGVKPDVSWKIVQSVDGNKVTVNDKGTPVTFTMANGCKVYNVTNIFESHKGEITTVQPGDSIVTLVNGNKQAVIVYVCGGRTRQFNTNQNECPCASKPAWKAWDGSTKLTSGYYYLTKDVTVPEGGIELDSMNVSLRLDGHKLTNPAGSVFVLKNGSILNICDHETRGALVGKGYGGDAGGVLRLSNSNTTVNLYNIDVYTTGGVMDNGAVISNSGYLSLYNVNVTGGEAAKKGGAICVMPSGSLRMFGGSVQGGTAAADGDNLFIAGNAYLEDVTVEGGIAANAEGKTFVIRGGSISGGKYGLILRSGTLALSGAVKLAGNTGSDLVVETGAVLDVKELSKDAQISLSAAPAGDFAINAAAQLTGAVVSGEEQFTVIYNEENKSLQLKFAHTHCVCDDLKDHSCQEVGYTKLTQAMFTEATASSTPVKLSGANFSLAAGDYYLDEDITLSGQILITPGKVNLCLNGHGLIATETRALAISGAEVTITDCGENGFIQGGKAANAGTILLQTSSGEADGQSGSLDIYAGTILGGETTKANIGHAGNIQIKAGTVNVYGGTLQGGTALALGGNVFVAADACLNLYGGKLTSGTASKGDCLYVAKGANVTLDGVELVEAIYLSDAKLNVAALPENFITELTSTVTGVFAENVAADYSGCFAVSGSTQVVYDAEAKTLATQTVAVETGHKHCLCNGFDGHSCQEVSWVGLNAADVLGGNFTASADQYYYLTEDVDLTGSLAIARNTTLNLCLNGHTLNAPATKRAINVNGGTLNLTDCGENGKVLSTKEKNGGVMYIQMEGTFNMYGGTLQGTEAALGGAVFINAGVMNLYDGSVVGCQASSGGTIFVKDNQKLNLYGGRVISGTANDTIDCIRADAGATVTLNKPEQVDAIYLKDGSLVVEELLDSFTTVLDASSQGILIENIEKAQAEQFVPADGKTFTYDETAKTLSWIISDDQPEEPTGHKHCICNGFDGHSCQEVSWTGLTAADVLGGSFTAAADQYYYLTEDVDLTGSLAVAKNTTLNLCLNGHTLNAPATKRAINVNGGTLNLTDCGETGKVLSTKEKNGGVMYIQMEGTFNMYGGTLQGTEATNGGAVYVAAGAMSLYGGTVKGCNVSNAAGAICVAGGQTLNLFGGTVEAGTAKTKANCILVLSSATVNLGGNIQIQEIFLNNGAKAALSAQYPLQTTARIGVQMQTAGQFLQNVQTYTDGIFTSRMTGKTVKWDSEKKTLSLA